MKLAWILVHSRDGVGEERRSRVGIREAGPRQAEGKLFETGELEMRSLLFAFLELCERVHVVLISPVLDVAILWGVRPRVPDLFQELLVGPLSRQKRIGAVGALALQRRHVGV